MATHNRQARRDSRSTEFGTGYSEASVPPAGSSPPLLETASPVSVAFRHGSTSPVPSAQVKTANDSFKAASARSTDK
jgi:hypothetical protein